jgi:hypothetical protein
MVTQPVTAAYGAPGLAFASPSMYAAASHPGMAAAGLQYAYADPSMARYADPSMSRYVIIHV